MSAAFAFDAVVFDCDGTLADTESLSERAWSETLAEHGYTATASDFAAVIGHPFSRNWTYFSARVDLGDPEAFRARLRTRFRHGFDAGVELYADVVAVLRALIADGVAVGVASSSSHAHVLAVLERGGLVEAVGAVVGAGDVSRPKPDPEPYLTAARMLGVAASSSAAVEDTSVGIASARAAGMFTVGLDRGRLDPATLAGAHRLVTRLTLDDLEPPNEAQRAQASSNHGG